MKCKIVEISIKIETEIAQSTSAEQLICEYKAWFEITPFPKKVYIL